MYGRSGKARLSGVPHEVGAQTLLSLLQDGSIHPRGKLKWGHNAVSPEMPGTTGGLWPSLHKVAGPRAQEPLQALILKIDTSAGLRDCFQHLTPKKRVCLRWFTISMLMCDHGRGRRSLLPVSPERTSWSATGFEG